MEKTFTNVAQAFLGESQARNRYNMYAKVAKEEGYEQIAAIFAETAEQEKEHAVTLYKWLIVMQEKPENAGGLSLDGVGVPLVRGTTEENLVAAIEGETEEESHMYPSFADIAEEEGYRAEAAQMRAIAKAEGGHAMRYQKLLEAVRAGFFERSEAVTWRCRECGYLHTGKSALAKCPSCLHAQAYFELNVDKF